MIAYLLPFIGLSALDLSLPYGQRRRLYWFAFAVLFLFVAFRFQVGCDWGGYLRHYTIVKDPDFQVVDHSDPLWWWLVSQIEGANLDYVWLNVATTAFFFAGVHLMARRQPDPLTFIILLFPVLMIHISMSALRQAIAVGFVCAAFMAFVDRRLVLFVALIFLGAQFHASALVFLFLAPLVHGQYSKVRLISAVLLALPGAYFLASGEAALQATDRYIDGDLDAFGAIFRVGFVSLSGLGFLWTLNRSWKHASPQDYKLAITGSLMMVATLFLLPVSSVIADRLAYYLVPIQVMIFARLPFLPLAAKVRRMVLPLPWIGNFAIFTAWISLSWIFRVCYTPYRSWLFGG